jgi:hypothetical protein
LVFGPDNEFLFFSAGKSNAATGERPGSGGSGEVTTAATAATAFTAATAATTMIVTLQLISAALLVLVINAIIVRTVRKE